MKYHPGGQARRRAAGRARPLSPGRRSRRSSRPPTSARPSSARSRPPRASKNADAIAAVDGVDCLWVGHFDLSVSLGIPGEFDHPDFKQAIDKTVAAAKKHKKALGRLVPTVEQGIDVLRAGLRLHLLLRRRLGAARCACRRRSPSSAPAARKVGDGRWPTQFRVALSGDFRKADGSPTYPDFDLAPLRAAPGVEMAFLESAQPAPRRAARGFRRADPARPPLRRGERAEERAARRRRALRRRLRHGRCRRLHARRASRSSSRRTACAGRWPSRSSPSCWR